MKEHHYIDELSASYNKDSIVLSDVKNSILENNLYGVDINQESVEIAKLSLWLNTAESNRKLTSLNNNIKCGNSLIDDPEVAGEKAFNWELEFSDVFKNGGFDIIIGNPPYGAKISKNHIDYIIQKHQNIITGEIDTYIVFYLIASSITKIDGILGFITPDTWLTISRANGLRKIIYETHTILDVCDWYKPFKDAKDTRCHSICMRCNINSKYDFKVTVVDSKEVVLKSYFLNQKILADFSQWNLYTSPNEKRIFTKMISVSSDLELRYNLKV